jgi:hypothetical protein
MYPSANVLYANLLGFVPRSRSLVYFSPSEGVAFENKELSAPKRKIEYIVGNLMIRPAEKTQNFFQSAKMRSTHHELEAQARL